MSDLRNGINRLVGNTKRNRGGNQQPYVPAGNGDESGEYADMIYGGNVHYTPPQPVPPPVEKVKKTSRFNEIKSLKEKRAIYEHIRYKTDYGYSTESIISNLRYYTGSFGDLSMFSDDDLRDMIEQVKEIEQSPDGEIVYFQKGGKWYVSKNKDKLDLIGQKYYTKEEREAFESKKIAKQGKQGKIDTEINNIFGENCLVNFGKGFDDEYLSQVRDSSQKMVNDFNELSGFIRGIGDRNSLNKYSQAVALQNLDETKVNELAQKIYDRATSYGRNISMEQAIAEAKTQLTKGFELSRGGRTWLAYWSPSQRCLVMLPRSKEDMSEIEGRFNRNWHSSNQLMGTFTHEMGHAIDSLCEHLHNVKSKELQMMGKSTYELNNARHEFNDAIRDKLRENINKDYITEYINRYNSKHNTDYHSIAEIERYDYRGAYETRNELRDEGFKKYKLSEYGNTNTAELIAESFSAYYTGMNNEFANSVVEIVKNYYNKLKGI